MKKYGILGTKHAGKNLDLKVAVVKRDVLPGTSELLYNSTQKIISMNNLSEEEIIKENIDKDSISRKFLDKVYRKCM